MIYKLNRDMKDWKKGDEVYPDPSLSRDDVFNTWLALGWLDPVEEGRWKPKSGEKYYVPSFDGTGATVSYWDDDSFDIERYTSGIVFKTREQAEEAAKKVKELLLSLHEK